VRRRSLRRKERSRVADSQQIGGICIVVLGINVLHLLKEMGESFLQMKNNDSPYSPYISGHILQSHHFSCIQFAHPRKQTLVRVVHVHM
jgi:hypothetical protein